MKYLKRIAWTLLLPFLLLLILVVSTVVSLKSIWKGEADREEILDGYVEFCKELLGDLK